VAVVLSPATFVRRRPLTARTRRKLKLSFSCPTRELMTRSHPGLQNILGR